MGKTFIYFFLTILASLLKAYINSLLLKIDWVNDQELETMALTGIKLTNQIIYQRKNA